MGYQPQLRRSHEKIDRSRWSRVLTLAAAVIGDCAQAAAVAPGGLRQGADELVIVEKAQFYWDGWRGPGWYWCGYEWHRGLGWRGPSGWRGWRGPVHSIVREIGPEPERTRPGAGGPAAVAREATAAAVGEAIIRAERSRSFTNQHAALCQRRGNIGPKADIDAHFALLKADICIEPL